MENLKKIANVNGKPGLYRIAKPARSGVLIESLEDKPRRTIVPAQSKLSVLSEISVYTTGEEDSMPLADVFKLINEKHKGTLPVSGKNSKEELTAFIEEVLPEYDSERVYYSDMKKLVNWYNLLIKYEPDLFTQKEEAEEENATVSEEAAETETKSEATPSEDKKAD